MHYPIKEEQINKKEIRKELYKNICRAYHECNDWESFRVKADLIGISKFSILKFWLYYTYKNQGWFPIVALLSIIPIVINGILFLLGFGMFAIVILTCIQSLLIYGIMAFLHDEYFPNLCNDIKSYSNDIDYTSSNCNTISVSYSYSNTNTPPLSASI